MVAALEEILETVELWWRSPKRKQSHETKNFDPVLLVPGIAGSILEATTKDGHKERVWVRIFGADHKFRTKLWSQYDPATGKTTSLDPETGIVVPEDRHGLFAIDILDPAMMVGRDCVCYFHDMIEEMISWGLKEGETLFGFGYDFRQSNRIQETMEHFSAKLESVYKASGCRKINIISHSMGGLLVKSFMALHVDVFEKYVKCWVAIAAPFCGAPGYVTASLLNGVSFVDGWEKNFFISKWSVHQLLIECPSMYELFGSPDYKWHNTPFLQVWRQKHENPDASHIVLESYNQAETITVMRKALSGNKVAYNGEEISLPFNLDILKWANETQKILSSAELPSAVKFYNIYGTSYNTPHSICYGCEQSPVSEFQELLLLKATYGCIDGDGTVPLESAKADGLDADARIGVSADHHGLLSDHHVFRVLKQWLQIDLDPYYSPVDDYVILPSLYEKKHKKHNFELPGIEEEWEVVYEENELPLVPTCLPRPMVRVLS